MTNFIPIFPLGIVFYPEEELKLHIFEPRYKQLIAECNASKKPFGIPAVIDDRVQEYGTLVEIASVSKLYDNGEMDIKTKGVKVFRTLELIKEVPDKLFSGAIVNYPENHLKGKMHAMSKLMKDIRELHHLLKVSKKFNKKDSELKSYDVAHHIGLSIHEEYELLVLLDERQRQQYLQQHLAKVVPMLTGMEQLKEKIKMNGHFKNLSGFDL